MKLLVGGDSFAQFPSHWYKCVNNELVWEYPSSSRGEGFSVTYDFKHWAELLADQYNGSATSIGIGAGDISTTTFVTIQELLKNNYTHCMLFVTHFSRDCLDTKYVPAIDKVISADSRPIDDLYSSTDIIDCNIGRAHDPLSNYRLTSCSWFNDTDEIKGSFRDEIDHYLKHHADFKYIHDRVSNVALLKSVCQQQGIKLLLNFPFGNNHNAKYGLPTMLDLPGFSFAEIVNQDAWSKTEMYKWMLTHYTEQQHEEIYNHFLKTYPTWGETDD